MDERFETRLKKIENALERALPARQDSGWLSRSFDAIAQEDILDGAHSIALPCKELLSLGGKRWRPLLLVLCAEAARSSRGESAPISEDGAFDLAPLVEFAHTASLIHDDIEDSADTRRGKSAAHIAHGIDVALNSASWLYFEAAVCIDSLDADICAKEKLRAIYGRRLRQLHLGQALDILWHGQKDFFPTLAQYSAMTRCKTGALAALAAQAGALAGGASDGEAERAGKIAMELGEGFQAMDDARDIMEGNPGKKRGDDIVEGKKSLPVIFHLEKNPGDKNLVERCFERARIEGINSSAVDECVSLLEKSGAAARAFEYGERIAREKSRALSELFGESGEASKMIVELFGEHHA